MWQYFISGKLDANKAQYVSPLSPNKRPRSSTFLEIPSITFSGSNIYIKSLLQFRIDNSDLNEQLEEMGSAAPSEKEKGKFLGTEQFNCNS